MSPNQPQDRKSLLAPLGTSLVLIGLVLLIWVLRMGTIRLALCGIMIASSGAIVACGAFFTRKSEMFWLNLFRGSLYCVIGFMIVSKPSSTQNALGMIVSAVMLVEGIFEVTPFIIFGGRKRVIRTLIGTYAIIAGVSIWATWPSGLANWLVYLCLAIDMILNGANIFAASFSNHVSWYMLVGKYDAEGTVVNQQQPSLAAPAADETALRPLQQPAVHDGSRRASA